MKAIAGPAAAAKIAQSALPDGAAAARDSSPEAIRNLQKSYQAVLDRMVQELDSQAHFVRYAPPAFIPFHNGLYLQVSLTTTLPPAAAGSQYRLAALAFDQHIVHLIRPVLAYFRDRTDFDGIDFSTTVRLNGQQLIDGSFVLLNGERASLNLQVVEAGPSAQ
jgi:hypothetical protein